MVRPLNRESKHRTCGEDWYSYHSQNKKKRKRENRVLSPKPVVLLCIVPRTPMPESLGNYPAMVFFIVACFAVSSLRRVSDVSLMIRGEVVLDIR